MTKYICNKSGYWDFCKYCHHSEPHDEIDESKINELPRMQNDMASTTSCNFKGTVCNDDTNREIKVKCIEYCENEDKIKEIMNEFKISRKKSILIYENLDKLRGIIGE